MGSLFKKDRNKIRIVTDIDMLLMVEKRTRGGICQAIHRYAKANNKYMKNYEKNIESSYLMYLDANNLYWWAISQKLPVDGFELIKNLSEFNEDFIKNYNEDSNKGYFFEVDVEYPKNLHNLHSDLQFHLKDWKLKNVISLFVTLTTRKIMLCI